VQNLFMYHLAISCHCGRRNWSRERERSRMERSDLRRWWSCW